MQKTALVFTDSHSQCGVGRFNAEILTALTAEGYRAVCAQRYETSPLLTHLQTAGAEFRWLDGNPELNMQEFVKDIRQPALIYDEVKPDFIIFSNGHLQLSYAAIEAAIQYEIPYLIREGMVAGQFLPSNPGVIAGMRRHYELAQAVICMCAENQFLMNSHFGLPVHFGDVLAPSAADHFFQPVAPARRNALREKIGIPDSTPLAITVAKLEPVKGYDIQLDAIEALANHNPPLNMRFLWIGGGGQATEISAQISRRNLEGFIQLTGHVWNVADYLDAADLFILTSYAEGLPHVIVEAMAKGLPVIATGVGGVEEALNGHGVVLSVKNGAAQVRKDLCAVLKDWPQSKDEHRRRAERGRQRAIDCYRENKIISRYLNIIENGRSHPRPQRKPKPSPGA